MPVVQPRSVPYFFNGSQSRPRNSCLPFFPFDNILTSESEEIEQLCLLRCSPSSSSQALGECRPEPGSPLVPPPPLLYLAGKRRVPWHTTTLGAPTLRPSSCSRTTLLCGPGPDTSGARCAPIPVGFPSAASCQLLVHDFLSSWHRISSLPARSLAIKK